MKQFFIISSFISSFLFANAQPRTNFTLLKDIEPFTNSNPQASAANNTNNFSIIQSYVISNNIMYYVADDGINGRELWRSDGTSAGTILVRDINPGITPSNPANLIDVNGVLYFTASTPGEGSELWKTDGTVFGTALVKDIFVGASSSNIASLAALNGALYFRAQDAANGSELWRSDGTSVGTTILRDIFVGVSGSTPQNLNRVGNLIFFNASDGTNGIELWRTDGTNVGTVLVRDINSGIANSSPSNLTNVGGTLFFTATDATNGTELWKSDGTTAGTVLVRDINPGSLPSSPSNLTAIGSTLFFGALDATNGTELWISNGTTAGTVLVRDINIGSGNSSPANMTLYNGAVYFRADNGINGFELWRSDGTNAGTVLVRDINTGINSSFPVNITPFSSGLYFRAVDDINGSELWKTDGTTAGTTIVKDINQGIFSGAPNLLTVYNGALYFSANDGIAGTEPFKSDGTAVGTVLLKDINITLSGNSNMSASPLNFTTINNKLYFQAFNTNSGFELWQTDGTSAGTTLLKDIFEGNNGSNAANFTTFNNATYFTANALGLGTELWRTDGTAAGTVLVKDFNGISSTLFGNIVVANSTMFIRGNSFDANNNFTGGYSIYKSDGTANGTVKVVDLPGSEFPGNLTVAGNLVYFNFNDGTGINLWRTDGTAVGTFAINPSLIFLNPTYIIAVGSSVFFIGTTAANGAELWKSDGTSIGTVMVKDINIFGNSGSSISHLTNINGTVYFNANDGGVAGLELWKSDGTANGTVLIKDINPGINGSFVGQYGLNLGINPPRFFLVNGTILTVAFDGTFVQVWKTDGTEAGTQSIATLPTNSPSSNFVVYKDNSNKDFLFFTAGASLWRSDGTTAGTFATTENALLDATSFSNNIIIYNNKIIVTIPKAFLGIEPWIADLVAVLPLSLISFTATPKNNTVLTQWQTTNEVNVSHINVQRSIDGSSFTSISAVQAKGGGDYSFVDGALPIGITKLYYRLESVDKDGSKQYSKVQTVNFNSTLKTLNIYPNPVKETLFAQVTATKTEKITIQITDMQGKILQQQQTQLQVGNNTISLNTANLTKGSYMLLVNGETKLQKQFVKE